MSSYDCCRYLDFYIHGCYSPKTEMGGWSAICVEDNMIIDVQGGFEAFTTSRRMEISSFNNVLNTLELVASPSHTVVRVFTNSSYVKNSFETWYRTWLQNGWKTADGQDVKNQDILIPTVAQFIKRKNQFNEFKIFKNDNEDCNQEYSKYVGRLADKQRKKLEDFYKEEKDK